MNKKLLFISLLSVFCYANPAKELDSFNFSKGLDSYHNSTVIQDGYVQDANNVYFDRMSPVEKRQGYTVVFTSKTYAYTNAWSYTDSTNTSWIITRASDSIIASNLAGSIVKISTISSNDNVDEVNAFGNAYFVDHTQGVYYWNGTVTTYVAGSPKGSLITQFHSRVWVAGQAVPNGNLLNASKFLDGTVWTTGTNPNDPAQFTIGLQDSFDNITALYPYLDTLYITKYTAIYALYGFDITNFQNSILTRECGCIDKNSMQAFNKGIVLVSLRGLEFYDGYNCTRISDAVKNKMDASIQLASFNQNTWLQQTTADWVAGVSTPSLSVSTTLAVPGLTLNSQTTTYSDANGFAGGTFNSTQFDGIGVALRTADMNVTNHGFETGDFTGWSNHVLMDVSTSDSRSATCTFTSRGGNYFAILKNYQTNFTLHAALQSCLTNAVLDIVSWTPASTTCGWVARVIPATNIGSRCVYINIYDDLNTYLTSNNFISSASDITFYTAAQCSGSSCLTAYDDFTNGASSVSSGTYTSPTFDNISSNNGLLPNYSVNLVGNSTSPGVVFQNSSDGVTWADLTTSSGSALTSNARYTRFISSFTNNGNSNRDVSQELTRVSMKADAKTGSLKSQIKNLSSINSFGNFNASFTNNDGATVFSICSSTNSNMGSPLSCTSQTANSQIVLATRTYVQVYTTMTVSDAGTPPVLNSFSLQWFSGAKANPMSSVVFDNRYWLSVTTSSVDSVNDAILVLNPAMAFTVFDIHAGGLTVSKNNLYHADSSSSGNVYIDNQGYNDNGSAINAYVRTRDYNLGTVLNDALFDSLWPSMVNLGSFNVNFSYAVDRGSTDYSLATVSQSEFASSRFSRINFPLDSSHPNVAQTINFRISATDASEPWQFEGFTLLYDDRLSLR